MGKANSYEIIEYRNKIMREICGSKELAKLLGCGENEYPEEVLPYKKVFPHEYIPETILTTGRFLNYEISAVIDPKNSVYKDLTIYFFIVCHEDVIRHKGSLWYDRIVCELDNLFNDTDTLGVGKTSLLSNKPYCPQQRFKGRVLTFVVKDFNNGLRYGK